MKNKKLLSIRKKLDKLDDKFLFLIKYLLSPMNKAKFARAVSPFNALNRLFNKLIIFD